MKKSITQKELLEKGFEQFKFAGEYLFIGDAQIYIDRGDDDIILFHDGSQFIRFVMSQRDITVFYKGNLDMLRMSDNTDFNLKVISERFSLDKSPTESMMAEILTKMETIRRENEVCCKYTNAKLAGILDKVKKIELVNTNKKEMEKKLNEILAEVKAVRKESAQCCKKTNDKLDKFGKNLDELNKKVDKLSGGSTEKTDETPTEKPITKGGDKEEFKPIVLKIENGKFVAEVPDEYKESEEFCILEKTADGWATVTSFCDTLDIVLDSVPEAGKTYKLGYKLSAVGWVYNDTNFEHFSNEVFFEVADSSSDLMLNIVDGLFVADVPDEYKDSDEFCLFEKVGDVWENSDFRPGKLSDILDEIVPEKGKTYKLAYKRNLDQSRPNWHEIIEENFLYFSNEITCTNETKYQFDLKLEGTKFSAVVPENLQDSNDFAIIRRPSKRVMWEVCYVGSLEYCLSLIATSGYSYVLVEGYKFDVPTGHLYRRDFNNRSNEVVS